jgi:two-component system sensor histidine kinase HydH
MADVIASASSASATAPQSEDRDSQPASLETRDADGDTETDRLRARYAEIAQLAGGLAHEIRNPLSTMSLNLELMSEEFQNPESQREKRILQKIQLVRRQAERLQDILENFLRFARVQELRLETTDFNLIVEELRDFFEPQAMSQGILIRTHFEPDLPKMSLDADLFRQALLNLFINARQAMPDGGELMLRTRSDGPWNILEVTDTGVGMSPESKAKAFDAFYSTRPGGTGLGLPTTRKIVEAHGGTIRVQSEPGKGSQFIIRMPNQSTAPLQGDQGEPSRAKPS